jgi:DNA-directed RNA polymerase specialized sigma24 family protein
MSKPPSRAFSTNYQDHIGLVHQFARKGWGRMIAAHVAVEYEDVVQEMSVTFTKAVRAYDPEKGITFSAYVGRAIWNDFNRYAQKHIDEQMGLGLRSVEQVTVEGGDHESNIFDAISSPDRGPEEALERKQEILENLRSLTPTARFIAAQLISPDPALEAAFDEHARTTKEETGRGVLAMNLRFIGEHFQIDPKRLTAAIKELKTRYGV